MKVKLINKRDYVISLSDIGIYLYPNTYDIIDTDTININKSGELISHISNSDIVINDFTRDLTPTEGIKFITTNNLYPLDDQGKLFVHQTSKEHGTTTYWTGRGDSTSDVTDVGNGEDFMLSNYIGAPAEVYKYLDFNTINNKSYLHEGYIFWDGSKIGDTVTLELVTNTVTVSASTGTNFRLYGGFLVIPASGDGDIEIISDITNPCISGGSLVAVYTDETGYKPPAYWNADFNKTTNRFENITPAPDGSGMYNMYTVEIIGSRFVNNIPIVGNGFERLQSSDSVTFPHGMRMKVIMGTKYDDHEWHVGGIITMHREKTI